MSDLVTRAQMILLARTLHVPVERIAYLERLGPEHLHELEQRISGRIYEYHGEMFKRIGRLIPIIPLTVSLPLVQRIVPPMMTGRAAGAVGVEYPDAAADTLTMLKTAYAADCTPYVDPKALGELGDIMASEPLVAIVNEVLRRKDHITVGPFLEYAKPKFVEAVEHGTLDDEGIIFSAAYAYSASAISNVLRQLLDGRSKRIPRMMETVLAGSPELQEASISVMSRAENDVVSRIGDILLSLASAEALGKLAARTIQKGAAPELMTFVSKLSRPGLQRMAMNPIFANTAALNAIVESLVIAFQPGPWRGLLVLAERCHPDVQRYIAGLIARMPQERIAELPSIANTDDLWAELLRLVAVADHPSQRHIGAIWAKLPAERRAGLHRRIAELRLDVQLAGIVEEVPNISVEEVFYQRRRRGRRRGPAPDSWSVA
ncbi:hypothetical protein [Nocardia jinanensis]|uniref:Uncharacterized protein n=1 Tax=Nocardia jinanensis TaxID=382504 RepID=A0A917VTT2_9NOCA|nr:hypothetical protein [Nocardia jinanensis]GGL17779.1 hypothetical protein GCM10011588_35610 [Nocardia jinanensis]